MSVNDIKPLSTTSISQDRPHKSSNHINNTNANPSPNPHSKTEKEHIIPHQSRSPLPPATNHHSKSVRVNVPGPKNGVNPGGRTNTTGIDPQRLFELVSKNYETWQQAIHKQFQDEDNFSPFPNEDDGFVDDDEKDINVLKSKLKNGNFTDSKPIFDYSLLEALEKASVEFSDNINQLETTNSFGKAKTGESSSLGASLDPNTNSIKISKPSTNLTHKSGSTSATKNNSLLNANEIDFLRDKISQMLNSNHRPGVPKKRKQGFSLYDTQDEEGLHEANTDQFYDDDDDYDDEGVENDEDYDYDLDEVDDEGDYSYEYPPTHHIEVELNTGAECDVHGLDGCDCPIYEYDNNESHDFDDDVDGPSCEFTFEYDHTGKLVPTYNNVEEKLRLMSLQSRLSNAASFAKANGVNLVSSSNNNNGKGIRLPSINSLDISSGTGSQKSKTKAKKKKKKPKNKHNDNEATDKVDERLSNFIRGGNQCCLLCEYEAVYGVKPRQMIKAYNQRISGDERRREELRKKLDSVKSKAQRRQRDLRDKQLKKQEQLKLQQWKHHIVEQQRQQQENEVINNFINAAADTVD